MSARARSRNEPSQVTELLIRRILCPQTHGNLSDTQIPLEKLLPPLTSSNAVDLQLYAIIAVVMRDFVYSWYGKITPDQTFVEETIRVIAHCTRELEQRLRRLDLELLLLHEIPNIIKLHIDGMMIVASRKLLTKSVAFRIAYSGGNTTPGSSDPEILYHTLCPHPALSPAPEHGLSTVEQIQNEAAYRQLLVQGVLAVLLPTEDLQNPCLRILVADIIADMILGNGVGTKASAGWLLWEAIARILEQQQESNHTAYQNGRKGEKKSNSVTQLTKLEFVSSGADGKARESVETIPDGVGISNMFWRILQYIYLLILGTRFLLVGLWTASSKQVIEEKSEWIPVGDKDYQTPIGSKVEALSYTAKSKRPFLTYSAFELLSLLLELRRRMPWLTGWMSLIRHHLVDGVIQVGSNGAVLDNLKYPQAIRLIKSASFRWFLVFNDIDDLIHSIVKTLILITSPYTVTNNYRPKLRFDLVSPRLLLFFYYTFQQQVLRPELLPLLLQLVRNAIFPNNALGPARTVPLAHEQRLIKRRAAIAILNTIPSLISSHFLSATQDSPSGGETRNPFFAPTNTAAATSPLANTLPSNDSIDPTISSSDQKSLETNKEHYRIPDADPQHEAQLLDIESVLDLFSNQYMNKHMLYSVIELIIVRLVPEIQTSSVKELLKERLG